LPYRSILVADSHFRLQKLLGNVVISQGGVVPHIAPVCFCFISSELGTHRSGRNFSPPSLARAGRTMLSARRFNGLLFSTCFPLSSCIRLYSIIITLKNGLDRFKASGTRRISTSFIKGHCFGVAKRLHRARKHGNAAPGVTIRFDEQSILEGNVRAVQSRFL